ncbi:site-specific integrase [Actinoplanes sp. NPDC051411]|uniref:tyrosine-type recombinase/integrase n=1 Tax=Actinoplanes sp. NPDC051411 TaxID=3155522 RepID=UPI00343146A1
MGHVEDRWFRTVAGPDDKPVRVKTPLYGKGLRYRVRYLGPGGRERSKSFPDRQKKAADDYLTDIESKRLRGSFVDPVAGRITFAEYAQRWIEQQTFDEPTREVTERRLRRHIIPKLGDLELASMRPEHIRQFDRSLQVAGLSDAFRSIAFSNVSSILNAAVDDDRITKNPCRARSAKPAKLRSIRVVPWEIEQVEALRSNLPRRYKILIDLGAGCGMRQGEILGLAVDDIDFEKQIIRVRRQIRIVRAKLVFAEPKGRKTREVPLPSSVAERLREHIAEFSPRPIALPWETPSGKPGAAHLVILGVHGGAVNRGDLNKKVWWPAATRSGIPQDRKNGMHALRHFYASTLLDAGESIKALASYLGHADPGFTLRTYTHLMPSSEERTRKAIDQAFGHRPASRPDDGLVPTGTGQAAA